KPASGDTPARPDMVIAGKGRVCRTPSVASPHSAGVPRRRRSGTGTPVRRVERIETPVMFVSAPDESDEIGPAWDRRESVLGSLRGRGFFRVVDDSGIYRCCVQIRT